MGVYPSSTQPKIEKRGYVHRINEYELMWETEKQTIKRLRRVHGIPARVVPKRDVEYGSVTLSFIWWVVATNNDV